MPLIMNIWASFIYLVGSKVWFSPIIWYTREREVRLSIRVLVIGIVGAGAIGVARKLLMEVK
jgi:ABC-type phosphate/phosphonate transport system permease subunit